jgi:hypothetical protein
MATVAELYSTWTIRVAGWTRSLSLALAVVGGLAAVADRRPGAFLIVGGAGGALAAQLVIGVSAYRRAMRRPWPQVPPLDDEDEW